MFLKITNKIILPTFTTLEDQSFMEYFTYNIENVHRKLYGPAYLYKI